METGCAQKRPVVYGRHDLAVHRGHDGQHRLFLVEVRKFKAGPFNLAIGFVLALLIHHFGFLRIVDRNLGRILPMEGRRCLFSFMPWKSYILVMVMMLGGFLLRHSILPKSYLALLYLAIGTALMLSSVRYLRYLIMAMRGKEFKHLMSLSILWV